MFGLGSILDKVLGKIAEHLPLRVIAVDGDAYLNRYYVCGRLPQQYWPGVTQRLSFMQRTLYLHCFLRPDKDRELHNHPFDDSTSLVLTGGYVEERLASPRDVIPGVVVRKVVTPGRLNRIKDSDFHRVSELLSDRVWTLFFAGRKVASWGFLDTDTGVFTNHVDFIGKEDG